MIFTAGWLIGTSIGFELLPLAIMIVVFILTYWLKVNVVYLIPLSGLLGLILF
jgi:chromate transporter